jgi:hypothetical protein
VPATAASSSCVYSARPARGSCTCPLLLALGFGCAGVQCGARVCTHALQLNLPMPHSAFPVKAPFFVLALPCSCTLLAAVRTCVQHDCGRGGGGGGGSGSSGTTIAAQHLCMLSCLATSLDHKVAPDKLQGSMCCCRMAAVCCLPALTSWPRLCTQTFAYLNTHCSCYRGAIRESLGGAAVGLSVGVVKVCLAEGPASSQH